MIKKFIPAWMVIMEKFYKLVVFNHIYANGDDHLKNFSVIKIGDTYQLVLGLRDKRISAVLDIYKKLPEEAELLISHSFLNDKMKRTYIRIIKERIARFNRQSEWLPIIPSRANHQTQHSGMYECRGFPQRHNSPGGRQ